MVMSRICRSLCLAAGKLLYELVAGIRMGMQQNFRLLAGQGRNSLIAAVVMVMGAFARFHAAGKFFRPCEALVRVDMSLFKDIALLVQNRLRREFTDQVAADRGVTGLRVLMPV